MMTVSRNMTDIIARDIEIRVSTFTLTQHNISALINYEPVKRRDASRNIITEFWSSGNDMNTNNVFRVVFLVGYHKWHNMNQS